MKPCQVCGKEDPLAYPDEWCRGCRDFLAKGGSINHQWRTFLIHESTPDFHTHYMLTAHHYEFLFPVWPRAFLN